MGGGRGAEGDLAPPPAAGPGLPSVMSLLLLWDPSALVCGSWDLAVVPEGDQNLKITVGLSLLSSQLVVLSAGDSFLLVFLLFSFLSCWPLFVSCGLFFCLSC